MRRLGLNEFLALNCLSHNKALEVRLTKYTDLVALAYQLLGFYMLRTLGFSIELENVLVTDNEQGSLFCNGSTYITSGSCR